MNNFMKTIINGLKTWTLSRIKNSRGNWNQNDKNADDYIKNRPFYTYDGENGEVVKKIDDKYLPDFATVATSGEYNDLKHKPNFADVATSGDYSDLTNKPTLATVATSGSYNDLKSKPSLATVATSGKYIDLAGKPTIYTSVVRYDAAQSLFDSEKKQARNNIGASDFSGSYSDLTDKPAVVKYDATQNLSVEEMKRARRNIGATSVSDIIDGAMYVEQILGCYASVLTSELDFVPKTPPMLIKYNKTNDIVEVSGDGDRFDGCILTIATDGTGEHAYVYTFVSNNNPNHTCTLMCRDESVTEGFYDFVAADGGVYVRLATDSDNKHNVRRLLVLGRNSSSVIKVAL